MSDIDTKSAENDTTESAMNIVAEATIEASQKDLDQILTGFPENELAVRRTTTASPTKDRPFEIRADEGETLLQFHEACVEREIVLNIRRLSRQ
ncbi:hypothetical protein [Halococcus sediminicola]|uniref:hypothetical protein n=1 Tax=Halococcus sediminicola TaxID=1264579 RepID=UPI0006797EC6|nr:hypothetical protein [Halococcus sediminicola]